MSLTAKNWNLSSYTISAWTTLIDAGANTVLVKNVLISSGANPADVGVRVVDSLDAVLSTLVPNESIDANRGYKLDLSLIALEPTQKLQVRATAAGVSFSANGAIRVPA